MRPLALSLLFCIALAGCGGDDRPAPASDPDEPTGDQGSGGGPSGQDVPSPSFAFKVGDVLPDDLAWKGYAEGSDELGTVRLSDYHDPTGAKGIGALLITEGSPNCAPCLQEAKDLPVKLAGQWGKLGVKVLQLLVDNGNGSPASPLTAQQWKKTSKATWAVGVDPGFTFARVGSNPYPTQIVVDPRTLTIVARYDGYMATLPKVDELAESNQ